MSKTGALRVSVCVASERTAGDFINREKNEHVGPATFVIIYIISCIPRPVEGTGRVSPWAVQSRLKNWLGLTRVVQFYSDIERTYIKFHPVWA